MAKPPRIQIKDIINGIYDGPHATPKPSSKGPVFLGIKNLSDDGRFLLDDIRHIAEEDFPKWTRRVLPRKDDIVFTYEATLHRYGLIPEGLRCCLGRRMALLRLNRDRVIPEFLLYYFFSAEWRAEIDKHLIIGATVNRIPLSEFPSFYLNLPLLVDQKRIAKVLSDLDAKIQLNNQINQELEGLAKLIYDYWFVQFDFPDENGRPYKSSGGKMVYNEELKREIPEGWEVKRLRDVTSMISRGVSPSYVDEGGVCVLNQKCIRNQTIDFSLSKRHNHDSNRSQEKFVQIYDSLVNSTGVGTLGRVSMVKRIPEAHVAVDSHITIVRPHEKKINPVFLGFTMQQNQQVIERFALGSTGQVELSRYLLENLKIIVPPNSLQEKFDLIYSPILKKIALSEIETQELAALRDWLLPMLMNGQVRVKPDNPD